MSGKNLSQLNEEVLKNELGIGSTIIRKKLLNWVSFGLENYNSFLKDQNLNDKIFVPDLKKNSTTCIRNNEHKNKHIEHVNNFSPSKDDALILEQFEGNSLGVYVIKNTIMSIGYGKDNQIHSLETSISDHHAVIGHKRGAYFMQDLGSKHGTFFKVNHREPLYMHKIIEIGSYQFQVIHVDAKNKRIILNAFVKLVQD